MNNTERLLLEAFVATLDLLRKIAHAEGAYHDNHAENVQKLIEARLDSQTADEVDALK